MQDSPFSRITRTSRRLNLALFGVLPIALVLISAILWSWQRLIKQEEEKLLLDFTVFMGYIEAEERFLQGFRTQNALLQGPPSSPDVSWHETPPSERQGTAFYEGRRPLFSTPFTVSCLSADCTRDQAQLSAMGSYLSAYYSTYWPTTYYPAAAAFLVNASDSVSISVPALDMPSSFRPLSQSTYLTSVDAIREQIELNHIVEQRLIDLHAPADLHERTQVQWFTAPASPNRIIGLLPAGLPSGVWRAEAGSPPDVYIATLLHRDRINIFDRILPSGLYDEFWLTRNDAGLLLGEGPLPDAQEPGLHYTADGLVFKVIDDSGAWTAYYRVGYRGFFQDNLWLPVSVALLLLLSIVGGLGYGRWYNRRVLLPAQSAQRDILESETFSRTLIETAPIALCLLTRFKGEVLFSNALAQQWLGAQSGQPLAPSASVRTLLDKALAAVEPGTFETFLAQDGRPLFVAYAPTRYKKQDVILCAFADISARAEIERTLAQAKRDADKASEAKSTFLATMSHEIRTPLYGVLGTLELLGMTDLDAEQRQHLERIQNSSSILLQLISDILDITKIESGQLALESTVFDPRELIESCTSSYAALAHQKGLLLFSCVDTGVAPWVTGDAGRIRQILANLVSNAIKFTEAGHVIVRLRAVDQPNGNQLLTLQVVDTGIGIGAQEQSQLFLPFYQIDSASHTVRGTGLGLSICARLAKLMNSWIRVTSELGLGSSFSMALSLKPAAGPAPTTPDLAGARVHVRSPHRELSEQVCLWLTMGRPRHASAACAAAGDRVRRGAAGCAARRRRPAIRLGRPLPERARAGVRGEYGPDALDGHRLDSIGFGIQALLRGDRATPSAEPAEPEFQALGLRVLVAEDNPINQATLRNQLEQLGCTVTVASDGADALSLWPLTQYDALLTDVNMPKLNGYELASALRAQGAVIPIIGVTANAMRDEEERCMAAGMSSWMVKPIELRTLRQLLRGVAKGRTPPPVPNPSPP